MQYAQGGAVKLETESRGEQQLGEDLAFVRMVISLVVAWVVCCHGYKAGCNQCVQVESSPFYNQSANIQAVWRPGHLSPFSCVRCSSCSSVRARESRVLGLNSNNWY